jgi:hypothetical protein
MKQIMLAIALLASAPAFAGDVSVDGYTRQNGTYVAPYHRSSPDSNPYNNYGAVGNPYTGATGHYPAAPAYPQPQPSPPPYNPYPNYGK